ncbi:acyl-CoA dehydrogenase [Rhodococcus triatomae]|uniref:Acyl-CoA dehydrogenase n=1 Tax=Rhodococcus triatomae TaxID=300028 RepID=A0A1G8BGB9_9NOCA|nr:acyl-CoA dehydrogenase [Rhodococcus triatomae]QNG17412.1 acyl-CoA dehydrogenase [Rhodococcus triatomae]QNG22920.1 acyl-CoA dehydrogenase [Rhodococcus triatomae]SDH32063.1 hypothetical protein SAMN05444695_101852 [Rhodococcus triatomae]
MTIATTDEQRAAVDAVRSWADAVDPRASTRQGPAGSWRGTWQGLSELGIFSVAVPTDMGGSGASIADLAAMVEEAARALAPGPVLTTAVAATVVGRSGGVAAKRWAAELADGALPCALIAPADVGEVRASPSADGGLVLDGDAGCAIGADGETAILLRADTGDGSVWVLADPAADGMEIELLDSIDKSRALARVVCESVVVAADRVVGDVPDGLVDDFLAALAAAEAAGVARWCLGTAVEHAKVREQFGAPIGSFQAIKHLCAEMLCRVEKAGVLAWDAAVAAEDGWQADSELPVAAAAAAAVALDAAVDNAEDCIQVLGGIGFTWEHDAHFYLRRAIGQRQLLGGSGRHRARLTALSRAGRRRTLSLDVESVDGTVDVAAERARVRADVAAVAALPEGERRVALADSGYLVPHWPPPFGRGATPLGQLIVDEELDAAGIERPDLVIGAWAVPTILEHGVPEQIERFAGPTLRGEIEWCQLFSEPGAGSDLASLRTVAERVDGGWRLQGQKVWTSRAREADWGICLARTDRDAPKHRGITYFLVDMRSPGITIAPLREITGDALFNEVFLDDVFVPDDAVVGSPGDGWKLARTTLANERVAMSGGSALGGAMEELLALADRPDPVVDDRIGDLAAHAMVGSLLGLRGTLRALGGQDPGPESSVRKLVGVRQRQDVAELAMDIAGTAGWAEGPLTREFLNTRCLSIAGGTTQILLTVAAERLLGLPRG